MKTIFNNSALSSHFVGIDPGGAAEEQQLALTIDH